MVIRLEKEQQTVGVDCFMLPHSANFHFPNLIATMKRYSYYTSTFTTQNGVLSVNILKTLKNFLESFFCPRLHRCE